jgi:hypothetical protein
VEPGGYMETAGLLVEILVGLLEFSLLENGYLCAKFFRFLFFSAKLFLQFHELFVNHHLCFYQESNFRAKKIWAFSFKNSPTWADTQNLYLQ